MIISTAESSVFSYSHQHAHSLAVNPPEMFLLYSHMGSHLPEILPGGWQEKLKKNVRSNICGQKCSQIQRMHV